MKKLIIGALCAICVVASFVGCGSEPVQEEPIVSLKLDSYVAWVDNGSVVDRLPIISGNSGYSIIYPKKITVITFKEVDLPPGVTVIPPKDTYYVTDHYDEVDYSKDILYIHIDNDEKNIVVEFRLDEKHAVSGAFIVQDSKGEKRIFGVEAPGTAGGYGWSFIEGKHPLIYDPDYWQE